MAEAQGIQTRGEPDTDGQWNRRDEGGTELQPPGDLAHILNDNVCGETCTQCAINDDSLS